MRKILLSLTAIAVIAPVGGCTSAYSIAKAPFQVVGKGVDWATTSQDEADRNRGRKARKQEKKDREAAKKAAKRARDND